MAILTSWQQYAQRQPSNLTGQTQEDIEDLERKLTEKIDKLEQKVKTLKVSLSYAQEESASLKEGKYIFIVFYRLSCSWKYSRNLFKLIV